MKVVTQFRSVQLLSSVQLFVTPWTAACQASLSITNSQSLHKLMSIETVMLSNHLTLCCPLLLLPSIFPSTRVFSNESALRIRWPKYWSFSFNISPSNEHSELISFRMDWLGLLAVQGTLKSLLKHHSSKASILQRVGHEWETNRHTHTQLSLWSSPHIPGLGRSLGEGNGNPFQYSCLENPMDRVVHGVARVGYNLATKPHIHTWLLEKPLLRLDGPLSAK